MTDPVAKVEAAVSTAKADESKFVAYVKAHAVGLAAIAAFLVGVVAGHVL